MDLNRGDQNSEFWSLLFALLAGEDDPVPLHHSQAIVYKKLTGSICMDTHNWIRDFPNAFTLCDLRGIVVEMNEKAAKAYRSYGGKELIGKSLLDCHPEPARSEDS